MTVIIDEVSERQLILHSLHIYDQRSYAGRISAPSLDFMDRLLVADPNKRTSAKLALNNMLECFCRLAFRYSYL